MHWIQLHLAGTVTPILINLDHVIDVRSHLDGAKLTMTTTANMRPEPVYVNETYKDIDIAIGRIARRVSGT